MPSFNYRSWRPQSRPHAAFRSIGLMAIASVLFFGLVGNSSKASLKANLQQVRISKIDGSNLDGELLELSQASVRVRTGDGEQSVPASEIGTVKLASPPASVKPPVSVLVTVDGSQLRFDSLTGKGEEWTVESASWKLTSPLSSKQLVYAQLKPFEANLEGPWRDILAETITSDGLILTRPSGELTRVGGTIVEVRQSQVAFGFDDQKLEMSIEKLLGMTWFQPTQPRITPAIEVVTVDGSIWNSTRLDWKNDRLEIETPSKVLGSVPLANILEIRFGTANVRWVSSAEKLGATVDEWGNWKFLSPSTPSAFQPRFVRATSSRDPGAANQDLLFSLPGTYTFRAPEGVARLESRVERTQRGDFRAELQIEVRQDSEVIYSGTLAPDQTVLSIQAAIASEKRITLVVKSRSPSQTGTEVQWKQPRLLR
ncbi:hypothetical protein VN12_00205 [Pirellula sp. SH-Sr6A]|uniref:hypothetical protein n=1 Tax=Pirellula sp. SH-Sr6A TaxID=1632865 RepID=UPI00078E5528|nr:hypothetical protein [Pirellula sp. SH-Sr6A]AMV30503.1 hypothetical protein VN12_00205 [Pirellula sp. SH-Sr6A]